MSQQPVPFYPLDAFGVWREARDTSMEAWLKMRDASMEAWSKIMIDFVNSDAYSQATNTWLDAYLTTSQPFQQVLEKTMTSVLTSLNMPMRSEVTSLAQRLINIEMRLDDLDAKLDEIQCAVKASPAAKRTVDSTAKAKEAL